MDILYVYSGVIWIPKINMTWTLALICGIMFTPQCIGTGGYRVFFPLKSSAPITHRSGSAEKVWCELIGGRQLQQRWNSVWQLLSHFGSTGNESLLSGEAPAPSEGREVFCMWCVQGGRGGDVGFVQCAWEKKECMMMIDWFECTDCTNSSCEQTVTFSLDDEYTYKSLLLFLVLCHLERKPVSTLSICRFTEFALLIYISTCLSVQNDKKH